MLADGISRDAEAEQALRAEALRAAIASVAGQAELLAREMEAGGLADRGGPDALRLLAALIRASDDGVHIGHA